MIPASGPPGKDSTVPGPRGEKGERGDVLYVGGPEIEAAAKELRQQKARIRAAFLADVDKEVLHPTVRTLLKAHAERILREAGL